MQNHTPPLYFGLFDEAKKLLNLITTDPAKEAMLCNDEYLSTLPFHVTDLGFFIVIVPGNMHEKHGNFSYLANENMRPQAQTFLRKHNVQRLTERLLIVSTTCTWDLVASKVKQAQTLGYAAIAFTTPERLQILAENPYHLD